MFEITTLLRAAAFASEKHKTQRRKGVDGAPYINHPLEVADILSNVGGVTDLPTLLAALLHDTVEDTGTRPEEIESLFGRDTRLLVEEVTDDKSLPKEMRKRLQIERAPNLSSRAKLIKLADKISNVREVTRNPPEGWSLDRRRGYLDWAEKVIAGCRGVNEALERSFDQAIVQGREALSE